MGPVRTLGILILLSISSVRALGQTDSIPLTELDEVKLTVPSLNLRMARYYDPQAVDTSAIKRMQSRSLADVLARSTGIFVKNYGPGNISAITIRGMSASQTQITWNGMELNSPMYGMADLSLVPVAAFGSATLVPAGDAIGGSIDLTSPYSLYGLSVSAIQSLESFGGRYSQLSARYAKRSDTVTHSGFTSVYYRTADNNFPFRNNARFGSPVEQQKHSETELYGFVQGFLKSMGNNRFLEMHAWGQHHFRELPPPLTSANNRETQEDNSLRATFRYRKYTGSVRKYLSGGFSVEELMYNNEVIGLSARSLSTHTKLNAGRTYEIKNTSLLTELQGRFITASEGRYFGRKTQYEIQGTAKYLIPRYGLWVTFRPQLINFIGGPYRITVRHFLPNASIGFTFDRHRESRTTFTTGLHANYKYPTLNDLYWNPGGNPSLRPERAYKGEITLGRFSQKLLRKAEADFNLTAYSIYAFDFIQWQPSEGSYWKAQNLNEVWSRGAEASAKFRKPIEKGLLLWNNSYHYTRVSTQKPISPGDRSVGKQLIYVPEHTAQSSLQYEHKLFYAGAYYTYAHYRRTPDGYLPPYHLVDFDLGTERKWRNLTGSLSLRANNVFNESYQVIVWRPMPGRWYSLTLNVTWTQKKEKQ